MRDTDLTAQARTARDQVLPAPEPRLDPNAISAEERAFLADIDLASVASYMREGRGNWDAFMEHMTRELKAFRETSMKTTAARRHHYVLQTQVRWRGWEYDRGVMDALTLAWGWYGARVHGRVVLLPKDFLDMTTVEQFGLIDALMA